MVTGKETGRAGSANLLVNLHNGNAIFGASSTVQPAGLYVQCLIRYA
mgnify:CR=1 FL=1